MFQNLRLGVLSAGAALSLSGCGIPTAVGDAFRPGKTDTDKAIDRITAKVDFFQKEYDERRSDNRLRSVPRPSKLEFEAREPIIESLIPTSRGAEVCSMLDRSFSRVGRGESKVDALCRAMNTELAKFAVERQNLDRTFDDLQAVSPAAFFSNEVLEAHRELLTPIDSSDVTMIRKLRGQVQYAAQRYAEIAESFPKLKRERTEQVDLSEIRMMQLIRRAAELLKEVEKPLLNGIP